MFILYVRNWRYREVKIFVWYYIVSRNLILFNLVLEFVVLIFGLCCLGKYVLKNLN